VALWELCARASAAAASRSTACSISSCPAKYDPPNFALKLATKDVRLATDLGRELGVPMRMCNLAYAEMTEACNRGWKDVTHAP